jgi:hypothetical protein
MDAKEAARKAEVTMHEIVKNGTAYDSVGAFIKEGKLGAKDLTVMMRRKQIAPEVRALLGEYKDARLNYAKSASKMGRLIWNQKFLDSVREQGMGVFLFEGDSRPPEATKQIAGDSSETYAPLNGLWTYPEIEQSFQDALGKEQMGWFYGKVVQINGMVKFGKTVLSPTTAARNWQSAMFFAMANGHFDLRHIAKSVAGLREYFTQQGEGAQLKYLRELQELGVIYDNPYAGEMMRLLAESRVEDMLLKGKDPLRIRDGIEVAQKFYQYGDDFWKIVGFENEKALLIKHAGMSEAEAKKEAAERIRNTYPTYSMTGRAVNWLRRFPLAGTFVSFPAEIIRTVANMLNYIHKDLQSPKTRPLAMRRIAGFAVAAGAAQALQALTASLFDVDDDDEEAVRDLAPTWSKNSNFIYLGRDEEGLLRYIDTSFLDPYNYFKRPVIAMLRDQPWTDKAATAVGEMLKPFLGTDIAAGAIMEIMANKTDTGGAVYKDGDMPLEQAADIARHLRKALQPGIVSNLERTYKALNGEVSRSGKRYDVNDEIAGWLGWRATTLDPKVALYYQTFEMSDGLREATQAFNQTIRDPNDVTTTDIEGAIERTLGMRDRAFKKMFRIIEAAKASGMGLSDIRRVLRTNNVSGKDVISLMNGRVSRWEPSEQSLQSARKKAGMLYGKEKEIEFAKRYREAFRKARASQKEKDLLSSSEEPAPRK